MNSDGTSIEHQFPDAVFYRQLLEKHSSVVRETDNYAVREFTERHLQSIWYDPRLRPENLTTEAGEPVSVESPGRWNLEEGPDFQDAVLLVGNERRKLQGDIEIHARASEWNAHRHGENPQYSGVIAHITYHPGCPPEKSLPRGAICISLKHALLANPFFSFDNVDITAYPFAQKSDTPCSDITKSRPPEKIKALLYAAGEERIRSKTRRLSGLISEKGSDQALYEELMRALGFKKNREQFLRLASMIPLRTLRELAGQRPIHAYAILAGAAGLLPDNTKPDWDRATRLWIKKLWSIWWKHQTHGQARTMHKKMWNLSGVRPQNHPVRRLMAAANWFCGPKNIEEQIAKLPADTPGIWLNAATSLLRKMPDPGVYPDNRLGWSGKPAARPISYIGDATASAIISNVIIPYMAATGRSKFVTPEFLKHIPPEHNNAIMRQAAFNLLGPDHNPSLYTSGIFQQGLISIFQDFCMNDKTTCKQCALSRAIREPARTIP